MIRIVKLTIENFQSHEYTEIDFSEGLNVIIGPSDQGKSAILRALKWVLYNEPRGNEFIRHGTNYSKVTLELSNGKKITRERSPSKNRYSLVDENGDIQVFEGFGNDIPQEIIKAHGIPKVILDTDLGASLNISEQLEGAFLLNQTGAVRAKALGRLTGIHVIDTAIRNCVVDLRREGQNEERIKAEIEEIDRGLEAYSAIEKLKDKICFAEKNVSLLEMLDSSLGKCLRIAGRYAEISEGIAREEKIIKKFEPLAEWEGSYEQLRLSLKELRKLERLKKGWDDVAEGISREKKLSEKTALIDLAEALAADIRDAVEALKRRERLRNKFEENRQEKVNIENDMRKTASEIDSLEQVFKKLSDLVKLVRKLRELKEAKDLIEKNIGEGRDYLSNLKTDISRQAGEFSRMMKKAGKCPLCMNDVDSGTVERIALKYGEAEQ